MTYFFGNDYFVYLIIRLLIKVLFLLYEVFIYLIEMFVFKIMILRSKFYF